MKFDTTEIPDVYLISTELHLDERGYFMRAFDSEEFAYRGLCPSFAQCSLSYNRRRGTVRGMHWQSPNREEKLVMPVHGQIYDVVIDLRKSSPMYGQWRYFHLGYRALYIPKGVAHGFQTLEDDTVVYYHISTPYSPDDSHGIRYNDPTFGIKWPLPVSEISEKDKSYPDYVL